MILKQVERGEFLLNNVKPLINNVRPIKIVTGGAELGWVCTLMSPQFDFWYCKYDYGGSFIKRWHVGIHGRLAGILD